MEESSRAVGNWQSHRPPPATPTTSLVEARNEGEDGASLEDLEQGAERAQSPSPDKTFQPVADDEILPGSNFNCFLQCFAESGLFERFQSCAGSVESQARVLWNVQGVDEFQAQLIPSNAGKKSFMKATILATNANADWVRSEYAKAHAGFTRAIANLDHQGMLKKALESRAKILASWGKELQGERDRQRASSMPSTISQGRTDKPKFKLMLSKKDTEQDGKEAEGLHHTKLPQVCARNTGERNERDVLQEHDFKSADASARIHYIQMGENFEQTQNAFDGKQADKVYDIRWQPSKGRHMVATEDIEPGRIILVEQPHVATPNINLSFTHCHHCLRRSYCLLPCLGCPHVMFCSDECSEAASTYHRWECGTIAPLSHGGSIAFRTSAVRVLTQLPWPRIAEIADSIRVALTKPTTKSVDESISDSKSLLGFLSHVANDADADKWELYCKMLTCVFLVKFLETAGYFEGFSNTGGSSAVEEINSGSVASKLDDKILATAIMYRAWCILDLNSFSCLEVNPGANTTEFDITSWEVRPTATACYNTASFFNHSCAPNCHAVFHQQKITIKAARYIQKGEELCVAYTPPFLRSVVSERRRKLKEDYHFQCSCIACAKLWPTLNVLKVTQHMTKSHCPECEQQFPPLTRNSPELPPVCPNCKADIRAFNEDLVETRREHAIAFRKLQLIAGLHEKEQLAESLRAAYDAAVEYLNLARKTYLQPHFDYYSVIQEFTTIMNLMVPLPIHSD